MENVSQNPESVEQYPVPQLEPAQPNPTSAFPKKLLPTILILAALIGGYFFFAKNQSLRPLLGFTLNTQKN